MKTLDLFDLSVKTALVTGCDTGLGMAGENLVYTNMDPAPVATLK